MPRHFSPKRALLALFAAAVLPTGAAPVPAPLQAKVQTEILQQFNALKADDPAAEREEIAYIRSISQPRQALRNNLADDKQLRFTLRNLKKAGRTPANAPQLFATLGALRGRHMLSAPMPPAGDPPAGRAELNAILNLGQVVAPPSAALQADIPSYSGSGLSSIPGGTMVTLATLQLFDAGSNEPFGAGASNQQYAGGENLLVTQTSAPPAAIAEVGALLQVTYQANGSTDPVVLSYQTTVSGMPLAPPTVTAPVHTYQSPVNPKIKVCLSRNTVRDPNCDYGPYQDPSANPLVQLPVSGQITFTGAVDPARTVAGTLIVWAQNGGGGCTLNLDPAQFAQAFTISPANPSTIGWVFYHMEGASKVNRAAFGALAGNPCWQPDQPYGMTLDVSVPIKGSLFPSQFFVTTTPGPSIGNATRISPLTFTWGCFAEGTLVLMADGSVKAIELVNIGDVLIADASGRRLTVRETTKGTEASPMVNITDAAGRKLSVTDGHAMLIADSKGQPKVVLAKALKRGDRLLTSKLALDGSGKPAAPGLTRIRSIERARTGGYVYNVYLGVQGERFGKSDTTLIAGGIVTGDNAMQEYHGADFNSRPASVKQRLPRAWHRDYNSFIEQRTQAQ